MLVFLGPDELHTIWGGLLGNHFYQILRTCAPHGKQKEMLLQLDRALAYAASTDKPSFLRLPSNRSHFSLAHNCSYREKVGVLQVTARDPWSLDLMLPCLPLVEPEFPGGGVFWNINDAPYCKASDPAHSAPASPLPALDLSCSTQSMTAGHFAGPACHPRKHLQVRRREG